MTEQEFAIQQDTLLANLPQEFRGAVSYHAWETGHADGYEEVLSNLVDLIDMLEGPIERFKNRISI